MPHTFNLMTTCADRLRFIFSDKIWIETDAIEQLKTTSSLEGIKMAIGLPDLHPGKGSPIGAAFLSQDIIYPYLVGNDVGCGMSIFQTTLTRHKLKRDRWEKKLSNLENVWDGNLTDWLKNNAFPQIKNHPALGTLGSGNHFAELQLIEKIKDNDLFKKLQLNKDQLFLLLHSGSRSLGEELLRQHVDIYKDKGLNINTPEAKAYLNRHDYLVNWAKASRALLAYRFLSSLGSTSQPLLNHCHNSISPISIEGDHYFIHRKGATPANEGCIIIPGSRGSFSYLVQPLGDQSYNGYSLPHGAGRKWNRSSCKGHLQKKYNVESLKQTPMGNKVICDDKQLLYEEAPQAYKNIDTIIEELTTRKLIKTIAVLRPLITYKVKRNHHD